MIQKFYRTVNQTSVRQPDYNFWEMLLNETGPTVDYFANELGFPHTYYSSGSYYASSFGGGQQ